MTSDVVVGGYVVGHVDCRRHEVVWVRGVLVVVVQPPGEAEALALDMRTPVYHEIYNSSMIIQILFRY